MDGTRCLVVRRHHDATEGPSGVASSGRAVLDARSRHGTRVARRHSQGALPDARRPSCRGRPHALSRRQAVDLRLRPVGLPSDVHVLRDGCDAVRPEPDGARDRRPGTPLPPPRAGEPRGLHGHGRAVPELRRGARLRTTSARHRHHTSPNDDLERGLDARATPLRRRGRRSRSGSRSRSTPPIPRSGPS